MMGIAGLEGVSVSGPEVTGIERVLTQEALEFVVRLHRLFDPIRRELLVRRQERQEALAEGDRPGFLESTAEIRAAAWSVAPAPADLEDRRVEITGPVERKMMINAMNSGARVFMADFEDALSPTWANVIEGQANLIDAVRGEIEYAGPGGKTYRLHESTAVLMVRPRGWHLAERRVRVDGVPIAASLFDFGLSFFHNARELVSRGSGPYFYLPKIESHLEARLWNDLFGFAQDAVGLPRGTIRATVLIETILAAFEMEEILYEIREHAAGLNAGRWDYIFSIVKKLRHGDNILPDRGQVTMSVPFMQAYSDLVVATCHKRGAHAIGGMAAFIPSRRDPEVNETALARVREDKLREASAGFDGTWVAHPDLVHVAAEIFDRVLGDRPHQKEVKRPDVRADVESLLDFRVQGGTVTEAGVRGNVTVALQYLSSWLAGTGAAAILNLMEDTATAEISRAQLWQWIHRGASFCDGGAVTPELYMRIRDEELVKLGGREQGRNADAAEILDALVLGSEFVDFLTLAAGPRLD